MKNEPHKKGANARNTEEGLKTQEQFMRKVSAVYNKKCAVTQVSLIFVLQAAHILECKDAGERELTELMDVKNGIILRRDWHTCFDKQLWAIDPKEFTIVLGEKMKQNKE